MIWKKRAELFLQWVFSTNFLAVKIDLIYLRNVPTKPGGLECRDQSRSRILDLSDVLFQRCRDFLNSRDVLFQSVEIESLDRDKDKN
jgi:hypothetical protein